ncbi:hypothetical protein GCM10027456_76830 [Kineosporia babensis]
MLRIGFTSTSACASGPEPTFLNDQTIPMDGWHPPSGGPVAPRPGIPQSVGGLQHFGRELVEPGEMRGRIGDLIDASGEKNCQS